MTATADLTTLDVRPGDQDPTAWVHTTHAVLDVLVDPVDAALAACALSARMAADRPAAERAEATARVVRDARRYLAEQLEQARVVLDEYGAVV